METKKEGDVAMIEEELRSLIRARYGKIPTFCETAGIKYQTFMAILDRGVNNASISNVMKICRTLGISADALADGKIVPVAEPSYVDISTVRNALDTQLDNAAIDGTLVSEEERKTVLDAFDIVIELLRRRR